jgi:hypothetical protein
LLRESSLILIARQSRVARHAASCHGRPLVLLCALLLLGGGRAPTAFAAGDASESACPNEVLSGFRPYLADCRAYEMVTPTFKNSSEDKEAEAVASDGSRVIVSQLGSAAVGPEAGLAEYGTTAYDELTRTSLGWVAAAINPPAAFAPAQHFMAASADLSSTLWEARRPSEPVFAESVYKRGEDGTLVEVGPLVPAALTGSQPSGQTPGTGEQYVSKTFATSADVSHVVFESLGGLWAEDGDTTINGGSLLEGGSQENPSLYEYVGTGNSHPTLVGVADMGGLVSQCGTSLGSYKSQDTYDALSDDGETIFFTAYGVKEPEPRSGVCQKRNTVNEFASGPSVNELYARLGQSPINTAAISEPPEGACAQCRTGTATQSNPAIEEKPAEFAGASADGSKVFFTTEQELFQGDTTNNLYEYDFDNASGQKVLRVSLGSGKPEVLGVARVSRDGSHVYFVARGVLTSTGNHEGRLPVDGANNLYVFERDGRYPAGHIAFIATLSSETLTQLVTAEQPCQGLPGGEEREACEAPLQREYEEANRRDAEDWSPVDVRPVQSTPDGRFLVFQSGADLTPGDTSSTQQIFEYDALEETLVRVSVGAPGYAAGATSVSERGAALPLQELDGRTAPFRALPDLAVSEGGATVLFTSSGALTPEAETAGEAESESVYEYRSTGVTGNGRVYLISDGHQSSSDGADGMSTSGSDILFTTREPLSAQDVDTRDDIYDARSGGGFPFASLPAPCAGEACAGPLPVANSAPQSPGSVVAKAGENLSLPEGTKPPPPPKGKPQTRAQKLTLALKECRRRKGRTRRACEASARRRYGSTSRRGEHGN